MSKTVQDGAIVTTKYKYHKYQITFDLSTGVISSDFEWSLTPISHSRFSKASIIHIDAFYIIQLRTFINFNSGSL